MAGLEGMRPLQLGSGIIQNRIEEDSQAINTLVLSAKEGHWDKVWQIIGTPENPKKAHLINSIPENRRWGVLHQAVHWKDPDIVQKLLKFHACDSSLKTKESESEVGPTTRMTATELAGVYGCKEVEKVLLSKRELSLKKKMEDINTFQPWHVDFDLKGFGLIPITLAAYKKTFHPKNIDPEKSIVSVLGDIFDDLNTSENRWQEVRDKICDSLYVVNNEAASVLQGCKCREEFYKSIIRAYTDETTFFYTHMNTALRRQEESDYKPSADDLAMGPYVVMYQILLLFWKQLGRENSTTYRRMLLTEKDLKKYQVGVKFTWVSFVSSSVVFEHAVAFPTFGGTVGEYVVTFTINNTTSSTHQPRDIEMYARHMERERVYPAGAKFVVTDRRQQNGETQVELKLLPS